MVKPQKPSKKAQSNPVITWLPLGFLAFILLSLNVARPGDTLRGGGSATQQKIGDSEERIRVLPTVTNYNAMEEEEDHELAEQELKDLGPDVNLKFDLDDTDNNNDNDNSIDNASKQENDQDDPQQESIKATPSSFQNKHPLCKRLSSRIPFHIESDTFPNSDNILNAGNWWMDHFDDILRASVFPYDLHHGVSAADWNVYRNLLLDLDPTRLEEALLVHPRHTDIERIWTILEARRMSFDDDSDMDRDPALDITSPPLRILVMGGSVTEGVGCVQDYTFEKAVEGKDGTQKVQGRTCNWAVRLESFVNQLLGYDAVQVINIAQGGTGTSQALSIVKYWMYPESLKGKAPDIIIHAFGSNDSHLGAKPETEAQRISELHQQSVERLNAFVQTVQSSHSCPTPILIHLDDYVGGHNQGTLMGDFTFRMVLKEVAGWYHNMAVSSAQVVGDLIYPDTLNEHTFSPPWRRKPGNEYNEDVHFGYSGHVAIVWSWAYSALSSVVDFCNHKDWEEQTKQKIAEGETSEPKTDAIPTPPFLRKTAIGDSVHELQHVNPPPLDFELQLSKVSDAWTQEKIRQQEHCDSTSKDSPCAMAWVAGPEGRTSDASSLHSYLKPFLTDYSNKEWNFERDMSHGWSRKLGVVAKKLGAKLQLDFANATVPLKVLTIHSLKSYGDAWEGSEVMFTVTQRITAADGTVAATDDTGVWLPVATESVAGIHNSTSSISYSTEIHFPTATEVGSDVRVVAELVGGSTFKITGMMLCSR